MIALDITLKDECIIQKLTTIIIVEIYFVPGNKLFFYRKQDLLNNIFT